MRHFKITARIWLSVGVYILGYVLSTALGQIQSRQAQATLRTTAEALFPAAQSCQTAEAAFQRAIKSFGDAIIVQDAGGLDRAAEESRQAVTALRSVSAIRGLPAGRAESAGQLAASIERLGGDARSTYGAALSGALAASSQEQMRDLATRIEQAKASLAALKDQTASDLRQRLGGLESASGSQATMALAVFLGTLLVAGGIVHLTIRRSITGPVSRVIGGVKSAADQAARASAQMADSGRVVSGNAQEEAACIEETSASLEEISATTRQNADRAGEADGLMQEARQTVERAAAAMQELTASMDLISKSSNQVAGVLKNIDEIAFHTNILALNAAVEAARAGEAGAGFSVVADEVRSLAHRAAEAARNSGAIVERTVGDVAKGVGLVDQARVAFGDVATRIGKGAEIVSHIASSSMEQAQGIEQIGKAITRIEGLTQRNVATAQLTAESGLVMNNQVESTRKYVHDLAELVGSDAA